MAQVPFQKTIEELNSKVDAKAASFQGNEKLNYSWLVNNNTISYHLNKVGYSTILNFIVVKGDSDSCSLSYVIYNLKTDQCQSSLQYPIHPAVIDQKLFKLLDEVLDNFI